MALASLSIDLVAKLAGLEADLGKAVRINEKAAADIAQRWQKAGAGISTALGAVGAGLSLAGVTSYFTAITNGIDALNDVSDATGATVETISQLEDVALRTGGSIDTVQTSLIKMNQALAGSRDSDAAKVLKSIGLSAEELRKIDPADALQKIAVALNGYENDGNKARITQELFGKSLKEVAPLLKDLAENGLKNATVTAKQAEEAEKLNKAMYEFQKNSVDVGRAIASNIIPKINEMIERFAAGSKAFGGFFSSFMALNPITNNGDMDNAVSGLQRYKGELAKVQASLADIASGKEKSGGLYGSDRLANLTAQEAKLKQFVAYYSQVLKLDGGAGGGRGSGGADQKLAAPDVTAILAKDPKVKKPKADTPDIPKEFLDAAGQAREAIAKMIDDSPLIKLAKLNEQLKQLQVLAAAGLDPQIVRDLQTALGGPTTVEIPQGIKDLRDELDGMFDDSKQGKGNRLSGLLAEANLQFESGAMSAEKYFAVTTKISDEFAKLEGKTEKFTDEISLFWEEAAKNIQDAIGDGLFQILDGNFDSIGKSFSRMLKQMAAQALAADLNNALFGAAGKDGARAGGGWIDQGIGWLKSTFGGGRATGGSVSGGRFYEVNEAGPELLTIGSKTMLMMGKQGGVVTPAAAGRSVSSGSSDSPVIIQQSFTVGEIVSRQQVIEIADQARRAAIAGVAEGRMRRGQYA